MNPLVPGGALFSPLYQGGKGQAGMAAQAEGGSRGEAGAEREGQREREIRGRTLHTTGAQERLGARESPGDNTEENPDGFGDDF